MSETPEYVLSLATRCCNEIEASGDASTPSMYQAIIRAIISERDRCIRICHEDESSAGRRIAAEILTP